MGSVRNRSGSRARGGAQGEGSGRGGAGDGTDGRGAGGREAAGRRRPRQSQVIIGTIGHSTRPVAALVDLLRSFGATLLVDVRTVPRSRHNPQFNRDALPATLATAGIGYRHEPGLGGLRRPRPDSVNGAWREPGFRGFADYMQTPEFDAALDGLLRDAAAPGARVVIMCAEAVPWRCHRSLIADALVARGVTVRHILGGGGDAAGRDHALTGWARVDGTRVSYPGLPLEGAGEG